MNNSRWSDASREISLAGAWQMRVDPSNEGVALKWFAEGFTGDAGTLPGTVESNPRQPAVNEGGLTGFARRSPFAGTVWYQREITVPEEWRGKEVDLVLERCQWETRVWVDGQAQGSCNSLLAPHVYHLADITPAERHLLTVAVDNSNRTHGEADEADAVSTHADLTTAIRDKAKLNCGGHHLWSHDWNGIIGRLALRALDPVHIASLQVYPRISDGTVGLRLVVHNAGGVRGPLTVGVRCAGPGQPPERPADEATWTLPLEGASEQTFEQRLSLGGPVGLWDEATPNLYRLSLHLSAGGSADSRSLLFGMREVGRRGSQLTINGKPAFMRGTLECFVFPITGHPPMDEGAWRRILATAKSYGLNHFRFHTCCPPEAAFAAADAIGMYLQVELPGTSCPQRDEAPEVERFLTGELRRMLEEYGNHPSMVFVSMGNEQLISDSPEFVARHQEVLGRKVRVAQATDPRHLYTSTTQPCSPGRIDDYFVSAWPVLSEERLRVLRHLHRMGEPSSETPLSGIQWSGFRVIDSSRFNTSAPETLSDYTVCLQGLDRPLLSHEVGQWAVFPDLREISRYHGAQRACNFEKIRESLRAGGLLEWAADFTRASGMLSLLLYKEEIESALRTAQLSGFQLLDLHDFPGQGTSTVGLLSALWESKGLVTPREFRAFCSPVVALARLSRRVWTTDEALRADVEIANYSPDEISGCTVGWQLMSSTGGMLAHGAWPGVRIVQGGLTRVGTLSAALSAVTRAEELVLRVDLDGTAVNTWRLWVYPAVVPVDIPTGVTVATRWDAGAREVLRAGGSLLLLPGAGELRDPVPGTFTPVFWNPQMKRAQPAKTMGLLIDSAHPCLDGFPTAFHSDWQWWDPVMRSSAMCLDGLPHALRPAVAVIDSFVGNRRLAMVVEARVGTGRLLLCSTDLTGDLAHRPVARQLRRSILDYMASPLFEPDVPVSEAQMETVLVRR